MYFLKKIYNLFGFEDAKFFQCRSFPSVTLQPVKVKEMMLHFKYSSMLTRSTSSLEI